MRKLKLEELNRLDVETYKGKEKLPIIVVLDNVRSAHNVGSFFRTCDAFDVEKLVLVGITSTPPNREISKAAIGATESVAWEYYPDYERLKTMMSDLSYHIVAIEQTTNSKSLSNYKFDKTKGYVLIFGNEVDGVDDELIAMANEHIEIPQSGTKHSLNVSVCGGAVLWEVYKQVLLQ
jgi:23S rRNA (guanosine2251-2'-O)-methyltransferase